MSTQTYLSFSYKIFHGQNDYFERELEEHRKNNQDVSFFIYSVKKSLMLMHRTFFHLKFGEDNLLEIFFLHDGLEDNVKTIHVYGSYCSELVRRMLQCLPVCVYVLLDKTKLCRGCCIATFEELVLLACSKKEFANFQERDKEMVHFCIQLVKKDVYFQRFSSAHCFLQRIMDLLNLFGETPLIIHEACKGAWDLSTEHYVNDQIRMFCKKRELPEPTDSHHLCDNFVACIRKRYKASKNSFFFGADGVFQENSEFHYLDHEKKNRNFYHSGCSFCLRKKN